MMQALGEYVVSLTASAMICGIVLSLFPEGTVQKLLRLVCGVFLTAAALAPLPGLELPDLDAVTEYLPQGEALAAQGRDLAGEAVNERIKQALDAYILDKADALGASLQPDTILNEEGVPVGVRLRGSWTEETRQALTAVITKDLEIPEEDQQWKEEPGPNGSENGWENTGGLP